MDRYGSGSGTLADFLEHVQVGAQLHVNGWDGGVWSSQLYLVEDAPAAQEKMAAWVRAWPVVSSTVWRDGELVAAWAS